MPKTDLTRVVEPRCQRVADSLGFELVDVTLDKENTGKYLRIYIDRDGGMDLDSCEKYHRAIQPLVEDYDYDFLEVSSPGVDRPLKKDRDFERSMGLPLEIRLFRPLDGRRELRGVLTAFTADSLTIAPGGDAAPVTLPRKACSLVRPDIDAMHIEDELIEEEFTEESAEGVPSEDETAPSAIKPGGSPLS